MQPYRTHAVVSANGSLEIEQVPFAAGDTVEVVILPTKAQNTSQRYPLQGTPIQFEDAVSPVAEGDWELQS